MYRQVRSLGYDERRRTQDAGLMERVVKWWSESQSQEGERGWVPHPYWLSDVLGWFAQPCVLHFAAIVVA